MHEPTSTPPHHPTTRGRQVPLWVAVLVVFGAVAVTAVMTGAFSLIVASSLYAEAPEETETFFRLKVDRERSDILRAGDLETVEIPRDYIDAFGTDVIRESPSVVGQPAGGVERMFTTTARKGEILRDGMFYRSTDNRLGIDLAPGSRLFALPINTNNQPPNLAPDDYVDIYANVMRRTGTQAVLVMQRVQVRLVGGRILLRGDNTEEHHGVRYGSITVEVDRSQVQQLADIQSRVSGNEFFVVICGPGEGPATIHTLEEGAVNPEVLALLGLD